MGVSTTRRHLKSQTRQDRYLTLKSWGSIGKINLVSLNYKDGETIEGQFNHHKAVELPQTIVPRADAAGEVLEIGGVTTWKKEDRVLSVSCLEYLTGKIKQEQLRDGIESSGKGCCFFFV
jgi:hypothetical protein